MPFAIFLIFTNSQKTEDLFSIGRVFSIIEAFSTNFLVFIKTRQFVTYS